jgi:predicted nucleotidyltransferase
VARDEADAESDLDLIVDKPNGAVMDLFELARVKTLAEALSGRPVDVFSKFAVDRSERFKRRIEKEILRVF